MNLREDCEEKKSEEGVSVLIKFTSMEASIIFFFQIY